MKLIFSGIVNAVSSIKEVILAYLHVLSSSLAKINNCEIINKRKTPPPVTGFQSGRKSKIIIPNIIWKNISMTIMMYEDQNLLKVLLNPKPIALKHDSFS